jgi:hypothetical protein
VLSVPLTLLVKAVLVDHDPRAVWADALRGTARVIVAPRVRAGGRRHRRATQE